MSDLEVGRPWYSSAMRCAMHNVSLWFLRLFLPQPLLCGGNKTTSSRDVEAVVVVVVVVVVV